MISKELLSEVLEKEVSLWDKESIVGSLLEVGIHLPSGRRLYKTINIYELAHKCKEWALKQGYFIYSTNELAYIKTLNLEILPNVFSNGEDDETTCIFKACEWILQKKEQ